MKINYKKFAIQNWYVLFNKSIHKFMYELNEYQEIIISNHLRFNYKYIENQKDYNFLPAWFLKNMDDLNIKPQQADYIEESYSRNYLQRLIYKYLS